MSVKFSSSKLEDLAQRANNGDLVAGGQFLAANLNYWMRVTRGMVYARHQCDVEDLVQQAVLKLLTLWREGRGPTRNTSAFVMVSIRHGYVDLLRSSRTITVPIEILAAEAAVQIEIDQCFERDELNRALGQLSPLHRFVLQAVIIDGIKPAQLVKQLDRSAPAISNLLSRAKQSLRIVLHGDSPQAVVNQAPRSFVQHHARKKARETSLETA